MKKKEKEKKEEEKKEEEEEEEKEKKKKKMDTRSYNHCSVVKAITIKYSECEFVALGIQHAMCMRLSVTCDLSSSTVFLSHYLIKDMIFGEKIEIVIEDNIFVFTFSTNIV